MCFQSHEDGHGIVDAGVSVDDQLSCALISAHFQLKIYQDFSSFF
jgi:hypothetical protein